MSTVSKRATIEESMNDGLASEPDVHDGDAPIEPGCSTEVDLLAQTIEHAVLAPSSHNAQPWTFRIRGGALELHLDRSRALPVADPVCRELVISCGAALQNIRIALAHRGYRARIEILPFASNPDLLARVRLGSACIPSIVEDALFAAIPERHTNRGPYSSITPDRRVAAAVTTAVELEGAWLQWITDDTLRTAIGDLVARGDRAQGADRAFRRELAAWVRPDDGVSVDGIPGRALGMPARAPRLAPMLLRWLPWGRTQAARDRARALQAPMLGVLATAGDTPRDWMTAGQALQRLLLLATASGLSASFLNQPLQIPALRARLRAMPGLRGHPQLILRLGYAARANPTPRRSVAEVLR